MWKNVEFSGVRTNAEKKLKKMKKVLTKVSPSDNIYLADAVKTKQKNKKVLKSLDKAKAI